MINERSEKKNSFKERRASTIPLRFLLSDLSANPIRGQSCDNASAQLRGISEREGISLIRIFPFSALRVRRRKVEILYNAVHNRAQERAPTLSFI